MGKQQTRHQSLLIYGSGSSSSNGCGTKSTKILVHELDGEQNPNFLLEDNANSGGKQQQKQQQRFIAKKDIKKYHSPSSKKKIQSNEGEINKFLDKHLLQSVEAWRLR